MLDTVEELLRKIRLGEDSVLFVDRAVPLTSLTDLEEDLWRRLLPRDEKEPRSILRGMGILTTDDRGAERASVAGVLLCSAHPETWLPNACIEAVRFQPDSHRQLEAVRITGPLDKQIRDAVLFVLKQQPRDRHPQFSERAVFEAVVNAVVHRDYSSCERNIRLLHFADRLEIYSPGALAYSMTVGSLSFRPATRNELITSLLSRIPVLELPGASGYQSFMRRRSDGVSIILKESRRISGRDPEYRLLDDAELLLTIWSADLPNRIDLTPEIESLEA
jgi:predicted HTH transcriptional regulator